MISAYYLATFLISLALTLYYAMIWHKHFDVHFTLIFALFPIANLGTLLLDQAQTLGEAILAKQITYIGGCFEILLVMLTVFSLCRIRLPRPVRAAFWLLTSCMYLGVLTIGRTPWFYAGQSFERADGTGILTPVYGPLHTVFYGVVVLYFLLSLGAMLYALVRKPDVSRRIIQLLFLPVLLCMAGFFGGRMLTRQIELIALTYVLAQVIYLVIIDRTCLYDITDTGIDSLVETGDTGFVSFDFRKRYLASNETARRILPALRELTCDKEIAGNPVMQRTVLAWLTDFEHDPARDRVQYAAGDRSYLVRITYLYDGKRRRGYQLFFTDDTENQKYIALLGNYNARLQSEVEEKTAHIVGMHDKLILSMASMVESRDNSTGGHIRRTSEGVRILIGEMRHDPAFALSDAFCRDLIKAAPMHDLGKIAVDDAVLRKPGRFTPEEFEKMKSHAAEGARIVHTILEGTDDTDFQRIAENVAHYHHERMDGSGYPEGLHGEEIPLEARIMAVADVYDALVSRRVYKDSMSFEQADAIIMEGFGRHFDPALRDSYLRARPRLEAYYKSLPPTV